MDVKDDEGLNTLKERESGCEELEDREITRKEALRLTWKRVRKKSNIAERSEGKARRRSSTESFIIFFKARDAHVKTNTIPSRKVFRVYGHRWLKRTAVIRLESNRRFLNIPRMSPNIHILANCISFLLVF
uniref:Uncharacterized protein n=1 Tax=Cucumis melo TaxID=3656 RepID=A0A9I9CKT2_CUCME